MAVDYMSSLLLKFVTTYSDWIVFPCPLISSVERALGSFRWRTNGNCQCL